MHLDWSTLALQTINVLVLLWLLKRFLFRPVADIIAARKQAAETLLAEAAAQRATAQATNGDLARRAQAAAAEAEGLRAAAQADADTERSRLLTEAEAEIARIRAAAAAAIRRERTGRRRALEAEARQLAVTIASRLLARIPAEAATAAILAGLGPVLAGLPREQREALAAGAAPLEVVSAVALSTEQQAACGALLAQQLAASREPRFRVDPALLAGIELHGAHAVLRQSWQAELDRIGQELGREDENVAPILA